MKRSVNAEAVKEHARVRFEKEEAAEIPVMAPGGLIGAARRAIPLRGRDLALSDELFANDALCFLNPASRALRFEEASGAAIEMDFHGFDHVGLWTRPGAPFRRRSPDRQAGCSNRGLSWAPSFGS